MITATMLVLITATAVLAQPESFRSLSTSGMILDDIDLWVNGILSVQAVPDRVLEVEGDIMLASETPGAWMPRERWDALVRGEDCSLCVE